MIIDIHTHGIHPKTERIIRITNIRAGIESAACTYPFSYGIHPYDVLDVEPESALAEMERIDPVAIGEIGMDFRFSETVKRQSLIFKRQVEKAVELGKPIIIHAVRCLPQILSVLSNFSGVRFAIHGFRGSAHQAEEIVSAGGLISLSPFLPKETTIIYADYKDRILLETDETGTDITDHYKTVSEILQIPVTELEKTTENNFIKWIGNKELCYF